MAEPPKLDAIQNIMGAFGKYHLVLALVIFLVKFPVAWHQLAIVFLGPTVHYTCPDTGNATCPCDDPVYDKSVFTNTIVMQWNLICKRKWMISFAQTLFQFGTLMGSVAFGMAADRYGRKYPLCFGVVLNLVSGLLAAVVPGYWLFVFVRLLTGVSVGGTMVTSFVLLMEFVGAQYRDVTSALYQIPFNLGHLSIAIIGYYTRDYVSFQYSISIPIFFLLIYFLLPESPRWLIAYNRMDEAAAVLEKVAKVNKRPTEKIKADLEVFRAELQRNEQKKGTILDLFRTPNIRRNILAMSFNWLSCSYCFYGVSQYVGTLSGSVFLNVALTAIMTILGTLASIPLMKLLGRRTILLIFNAVSAVCFLGMAIKPVGTLVVVMSIIGIVCSFINFVIVYLYCSELFPTVVRNAAVGFSSMMARVGSMVAPFVLDLKDVHKSLPPIAFGILPLIATFVTILLPETKGCKLMTTIEEAENYGHEKGTSKQNASDIPGSISMASNVSPKVS